jgi:hypothetical protein
MHQNISYLATVVKLTYVRGRQMYETLKQLQIAEAQAIDECPI